MTYATRQAARRARSAIRTGGLTGTLRAGRDAEVTAAQAVADSLKAAPQGGNQESEKPDMPPAILDFYGLGLTWEQAASVQGVTEAQAVAARAKALEVAG